MYAESVSDASTPFLYKSLLMRIHELTFICVFSSEVD